MPVSALVTTVGAANANAYVSRADADQYHLDRPEPTGGAWSSFSSGQKDAAILWATKLMDALWEWNGTVTDYVQALLWPRAGLSKRSGDALPINAIPVELAQATAEFARQLAAADRAADSDVETQGITSLKAGSVELTFRESGIYAKVVPDAVVNLIPREWGRVRGSNTGIREAVR
jgi:hypothetical protein